MMSGKGLNREAARYTAMVGVGGIGTGRFFMLRGNHTLGREESRLGHFSDRRDYCKLHIISHYVKVLMGAEFRVAPVGKVGDDAAGHELLGEMRQVEIDTGYVEVCAGVPTLSAICFVYPDGSGGNLTTEDSACAQVDGGFVGRAYKDFMSRNSKSIALAVPEVPLDARGQLLSLAAADGMFTVASFNSDEMSRIAETDIVGQVDLLAINLDEAGAFLGTMVDTAKMAPEEVIAQAVAELRKLKRTLWVSITHGAKGSWSWDGEELSFMPAFAVTAVSTAGAGDAHLAGLIAGVIAGLPMKNAQELGTLVAAVSVASEHTIDKSIDKERLGQFVKSNYLKISDSLGKLLR